MEKTDIDKPKKVSISWIERLWRHKADLLLVLILVILTGLYGLLMVTDRVPILGLALLGVFWLLYIILTGRLSFATPMDLPILGVIALLPLSLAISVNRSLSLPKIYGLLLSIALFYLIVNAVRNYHHLSLAILALILLSLIIVVMGLLVTNWARGWFTFLSPVYVRIPRISDLIPGTLSEGMINVNTIGGAMSFFVPLLASLLWDRDAFYRKYIRKKVHAKFLRIAYKLLVILTFLSASGMLILTQSRGAILGSAFGLLILIVWKRRVKIKLILVILAVMILTIMIMVEGDISELNTLLDTDEENSTLQGRFESWRSTMAIIQDFPFTGAGIGIYNQLFAEFYNLSPFTTEVVDPLHAHNIFLAVAVDLGLPALVLYCALLSSFAAILKQNYSIGRSINRVVLKGLACGLLAHHIFGIMDAFLLGTKLGVILWIFLGLATAMAAHRNNFKLLHDPPREDNPAYKTKPDWNQVKHRLIDLLIGLLFWLLMSLAAVSLINIIPLLSLVTAILGGFTLGLILNSRFKNSTI